MNDCFINVIQFLNWITFKRKYSKKRWWILISISLFFSKKEVMKVTCKWLPSAPEFFVSSFFWWLLWSTPSFGDSYEALLFLVTPLKYSPHIFPLLLQNISNKKNQLVGDRNKSEWESLYRCLKANVEKSLHVFTVNLNTIHQT